jgi:hypothetical protein
MKAPLAVFAIVSALAAQHAAARMRAAPPMFEVTQVSHVNTLETSTLRVYANGTWSEVGFDATGKPTKPRNGRLEPDAVDRIAADLASATWKLVRPPPACRATAASSTLFSVRGKQVYETEPCGRTRLDDASAKALADIQAILSKR